MISCYASFSYQQWQQQSKARSTHTVEDTAHAQPIYTSNMLSLYILIIVC